MGKLDGKVAWITGAGTGIGLAGAQVLASEGATVVLSGRRQSVLNAAAEDIVAAGGAAEALPVDVADSAAVEEAANTISGKHGRIDILINSAGLNIPNRHWSHLTLEGWDKVIQIDLNGAFYCVQAVLPVMRLQKDGLIINISSWAGRYDSYITGPAYNAAKHAMMAMNASLNIEEGANGIRGCAICPGEVNTPILDARPVPVPDEERARILQPEDLGDAILYVATADPRVCVNEILISPTWNRLAKKPD